MIDSIEDYISEMFQGENYELGKYECLLISFNCLKLYCGQVGIKFDQIEDHYNEFKESKIDDAFWNFDAGSGYENVNEIEKFLQMMGYYIIQGITQECLQGKPGKKF